MGLEYQDEEKKAKQSIKQTNILLGFFVPNVNHFFKCIIGQILEDSTWLSSSNRISKSIPQHSFYHLRLRK